MLISLKSTPMEGVPQVAPTRGKATSHRGRGLPPARATFFNLLSDQKPTHCPSGEKKGFTASSVPGIGLACKLSMGRR